MLKNLCKVIESGSKNSQKLSSRSKKSESLTKKKSLLARCASSEAKINTSRVSEKPPTSSRKSALNLKLNLIDSAKSKKHE